MQDAKTNVNVNEARLKFRLSQLETELEECQSILLAILMPEYILTIKSEIEFVKLQLSNISKARKTTLKLAT